MITKLAFVSHPTRDMAASRNFFGKVLGLKQTASYEDKWAEFDTPDGKSIALDTFSPPDKGPYLALETDDIGKELARLRKAGVEVVLDVMDNKVCKMAFIRDPNGHPIMLHQMEPARLKALEASKRAAAKPAGAGARAAARPKAKAAATRPKAKAAARPKANAAPRKTTKKKTRR